MTRASVQVTVPHCVEPGGMFAGQVEAQGCVPGLEHR